MDAHGWIRDTYGLFCEVTDYSALAGFKMKHDYVVVGLGERGQRLDYFYFRGRKFGEATEHMEFLKARIEEHHPCAVDPTKHKIEADPDNVPQYIRHEIRERSGRDFFDKVVIGNRDIE
jgi:hypothetical protein